MSVVQQYRFFIRFFSLRSFFFYSAHIIPSLSHVIRLASIVLQVCTCSVASRAQWKQARSINRAAKLFIRCCLRCKHCWLWCSPCNSITKAKTTNRSGKTVWRDVHCFRYIRLFVDISYGPGCIVFYFIVYISFAVSSKCDVCMCAALYCAVLFGCVWCCVFAVLI